MEEGGQTLGEIPGLTEGQGEGKAIGDGKGWQSLAWGRRGPLIWRKELEMTTN